MDWNDLRSNWQARPERDGPDASALHAAKRSRLWERVRRRDGIETLVAALLAPLFTAVAIGLAVAGLYLAAFFAFFLVGAVVFIVYRLWRARQGIPTPDPGRPVLAFLEAERAALQTQAELLSSVAIWYWGPIAIGTIGLYTSIRGAVLASLGYAIVVVVICLLIEVLNRKAVRDHLRPTIETIDQQIEDIQKGSEENNAND